MKRFVSLLLTAVMLFAILPVSAITVSAEDYTDSQGVTYTLSDDGTYYIISEFDGSETNIVIPSHIDGIPVTTVDEWAFYDCSGLTNVHIPDSVTSIGYSAFRGCSGLTSITIPDSVTSVGYSAFSNCGGLTSITIPDSVTSIGSTAFSSCDNLTSITVEEDNTVYHSKDNCIIETKTNTLIQGCNNSIIPNYVTSIGDSAFYSCERVTSIIIPDSVTSIGRNAFGGCRSLESITVSENNKVYHSQGNCIIETDTNTLIEGCKNSVIPDYITAIGDSAFEYCYDLTSITIPNSVTYIGEYAFAYCFNLTSITIPDRVTTIGCSAFYNCASIISIVIHDSVTYIGEYSFSTCWNLTDIYCEAESQPEGWDEDWIGNCNATVHWGSTGDDTSEKPPVDLDADLDGDGIPDRYGPTLDEEGNCTFENAYGFVFDINYVNGTIAGEDTTLITNADAYESCNPNWAVSVLLKETENAGVYSVIRLVDLPVTAANAGIDWSETDLVLVVHSATTNPYMEEDYPSWMSRVAALALKSGDKITISDDMATAKVNYPYINESTRDDLYSAIAEAERLDEEAFTAEQWADIQTALDFAKAYDTTGKSIKDIKSVTEVLTEIIEGKPLVKGDADRNGEVDQFDYLMVKRGYFDTYPLYTGDLLRADVDGSGEIDQFDYLCIKRAYFDTYTIE